MSLYQRLLEKKASLAVVGLGYVGLPIAVAFAKKINVIGFDTNARKIDLYKKGVDPTSEVGSEDIAQTAVVFTNQESELKNASFIIVAVPTPINLDKTPDLTPVKASCEIIGRNLAKGTIVVFESTVYPGVTEDVCLPILEKESGFKCGADFFVGYSPERINPGDKIHRLNTIVKIVSGMDKATTEIIKQVYDLVVEAGTYPVSTIKTAEAIKLVENSQRDINIAFMNEMAMVFDRIGIDTNEVVDGMNTKWNALGFRPGLVGGHCIGVDPYYFTYESEMLGYHSQIVLAGRKVNDGMGEFVAEAAVKQMILADKRVRSAKVAILGLTFKENCPDIRNTKVMDIYSTLKSYGVEPIVVDPWASAEEAETVYNIHLHSTESLNELDCIIIAVAHKEFRELTHDQVIAMFEESLSGDERIIIDVKGILQQEEYTDCKVWRL